MNKTQMIIEMFTSERPVCFLIKAREYKKMKNPFGVFRDWSEKYFNVTRTKHSITEIDDVASVSFFDPGIDIDEVNEFIWNIPRMP